MKISIKKLSVISNTFLQRLGFSEIDSKLITQNLLEAKLSGKKTHGFIRLRGIEGEVGSGKLKTKSGPIKILKKLWPIFPFKDGYLDMDKNDLPELNL